MGKLSFTAPTNEELMKILSSNVMALLRESSMIQIEQGYDENDHVYWGEIIYKG